MLPLISLKINSNFLLLETKYGFQIVFGSKEEDGSLEAENWYLPPFSKVISATIFR